MVYKAEEVPMGITIKITTHRKQGNGAKGSTRKNNTGKKATVIQNGAEPVIVTGSTASDLMKTLRTRFKIPPHVVINKTGETYI